MRKRPRPTHDKAQMAGDYQQELAWYRKAAEQNNIAGEMHLAALYRDGGGKTIPRDMEQAAAWYRRAADQGDPTAQATLGVLYSMGQGVPQSDVEAYFWLDLAASVKGPNQEKYAANRQMIGQHITADRAVRCRGSRGRMEGRASAARQRAIAPATRLTIEHRHFTGKLPRKLQIAVRRCAGILFDAPKCSLHQKNLRIAQLLFAKWVLWKHGPEMQTILGPRRNHMKRQIVYACRGRPDRLGTGLCSTEPTSNPA